MGGGTLNLPQQCVVVYWTRLNFRYREGPAPVSDLPNILASIQEAGGQNVSPAYFQCGGTIPPDPNPPVSNQPPPPPPPGPGQCPDGYTWDSESESCVPVLQIPPGTMPSGGGDELTGGITIIVQVLNQIIVTLKDCCPKPGAGGQGGIDAQCCATIAAAIDSVGSALDTVAKAIAGLAGTPEGGGPTPGPPPDLSAIVSALDSAANSLAGIDDIQSAELPCLCDQLTAIAQALNKNGPLDLSHLNKAADLYVNSAPLADATATAVLGAVDGLLGTQ